MSFALRAVVELEPGRYDTSDRAFPNLSGAEAAEEWAEYWRACLADRGISIAPIAPRSWFVELTSLARLPPAALKTVLELEGDLAEFDQIDNVPTLSGGVAFDLDGAIVLEPQCCGDLKNIAEWQRICDEHPAEWSGIWIGHPSVLVRERAGVVEVSQLIEPATAPAPVMEFSVPMPELRHQLVAVRSAVNEAVPLFAAALAGVSTFDPNELTMVLLGLK